MRKQQSALSSLDLFQVSNIFSNIQYRRDGNIIDLDKPGLTEAGTPSRNLPGGSTLGHRTKENSIISGNEIHASGWMFCRVKATEVKSLRESMVIWVRREIYISHHILVDFKLIEYAMWQRRGKFGSSGTNTMVS